MYIEALYIENIRNITSFMFSINSHAVSYIILISIIGIGMLNNWLSVYVEKFRFGPSLVNIYSKSILPLYNPPRPHTMSPTVLLSQIYGQIYFASDEYTPGGRS